MNKLWKLLEKHIVLIIIVVLASVFRFIHLDKIPAAITGDELLYAITAKSIYLTGHDISGTWNPLSAFAFQYPPGEHQAELPYVIHLPFSGPFPFSLLMSKLPFAFLSIGIVILLYKIAEVLFGTKVAQCTGFIAAINPWLMVMGRTGYESTPATFFYLLSLYMLLTTHSWKILWSLIPLFLAFYSYIGTKLIFIPFVLMVLLLAYEVNSHRFRKVYGVLFFICFIFTTGFLFLIHNASGGSRISELFFPNSMQVSSEVDSLRKLSIQSPILSVVINKYTVYFQMITAKLLRVFSPSYLFIEGDQFFLPVKQSFFYMIDALFVLLGLLFLFSKNKLKCIIVILFILIGTFPHIFHKTSGDFSGHLALMFPFIILLIGFGISSAIEHVSHNHTSMVTLIVVLLYASSLSGFSINYFYQYPLIGAGDFHMRVLSRYLNMIQDDNTPVTVYSTTSRDLLKKYLFYTNSMTHTTMPEMKRIFSNEAQIKFQNIRLVSCDDSIKSLTDHNLIIYDEKCGMNIDAPSIQISRLTDAGAIYKIFNDTLCAQFKLNPYPTRVQISDFNVEGLSAERYCKTYFN